MNLIENVIEQEMVPRDSLTALTFSFFLTSFAAGWYIHYLYKKTTDHTGHFIELDREVHEIASLVESQSDTLGDHDQRIRLKKDYDEDDEIEEDKCQAWEGHFSHDNLNLKIYIWRDKLSTKKKNEEWIAWNERGEEDKEDSSVVVRDFYLGNSNPEFKWVLESDMKDFYRLVVKDTMINGWDSLIKIEITLSCKQKEDICKYLGVSDYKYDTTTNAFLQKCIKEKQIEWDRILFEH